MKNIELINKAKEAIELVKKADSMDDIREAEALKEELDWLKVPEELKDEWNDYYGDAKRRYDY